MYYGSAVFLLRDLWQGTLTSVLYYRERQNARKDKRDQTNNKNLSLCKTTLTFWSLSFPRLSYCLGPGVNGNSHSRSFPRMKASDSHSRIMGMDFFIPLPFPNFGNGFFSFPSRSRIMGMVFFIPFPFPNCGNWFFHFLPVPDFWECFFSHSLPVSEVWECFFLFPSCSRIVGIKFFQYLPVP